VTTASAARARVCVAGIEAGRANGT